MSMFQIITQEGWTDVVVEILRTANESMVPFVAIYFVGYHLFVTLVSVSFRVILCKIWISSCLVLNQLLPHGSNVMINCNIRPFPFSTQNNLETFPSKLRHWWHRYHFRLFCHCSSLSYSIIWKWTKNWRKWNRWKQGRRYNESWTLSFKDRKRNKNEVVIFLLSECPAMVILRKSWEDRKLRKYSKNFFTDYMYAYNTSVAIENFW